MGRTKRRINKRKNTQRIINKIRDTKRRVTKRINTNKRNTNKRNTNKRNTKNRITNKVNDKSDINKFIRKNLPGYKLIKILNSKQTGGDIYTDYSKYITAGVKLLKFDKEKDFVAAPTFSGARPGFTFQTGEHGSGYYRQAEVKEEPVCDNYLALYEGITLCRSLVGGGDGAAAGGTKMHSLVVFNVDTNNPPGRVRDLCKGSRKGTSTHTYTGDIMNHGGFKLFNALKEKVNKDSIRLPPRVKDKDYREVKVPTYIKRYGTNIVMEYIEGKTLKDYFSETIVNAGSLINEYKLKPVIIKVLEFIAMINNSYLSHNDYNFNNIMVDDSEPDNVSVTVIDYGIMSVTGYYHFPNTHRVPGEYYGPKPVLLNGQPDPRFMRLGYNIADGHDSTFIYNNTDIYAFFESLVIELNNLIFNALKIDFEYKVIIEEILSNYRNQSLAYYFQHWSPEFKDFMKLAFTYDKVVKAEPYGSTPADTLLDHPWLR